MSVTTDNVELISALERPPFSTRMDRLAEVKRAELVADGGHLLSLLPRPLFADPEEIAEVSVQALDLLALQTRLIREELASLGRQGFLSALQIEPRFHDFVNWEELLAPSYMVARLDLLRQGTTFVCCEINADSCVAGAEIYDIARDALAELGLRPETFPPRPLDDLAAMVAETARRMDARRIVILDSSVAGGSAGKGYLSFDRMRKAVAAASGLPVFIADERTYDPDWLSPKEASRTFVHRAFMMDELGEDGGLLGRLLASGTPVRLCYEADIRMDKIWFSRFWEALRAGLLTRTERALVEAFVPESWPLTRDNVASFVAGKDDFIFKQRRAFGGTGILIGAEINASELAAALAQIGPESWIVQRMLNLDRCAMPAYVGSAPELHNIVYGLYVYGTRTNGLLVRGSVSSRVVNVSIGHARLNWAMSVDPIIRRALLVDLAKRARKDDVSIEWVASGTSKCRRADDARSGNRKSRR